MLDLEVERLLHGGRTRVRQDRPVAEGARPKFHPALKPAHGLARDQCGHRGIDQRLIR